MKTLIDSVVLLALDDAEAIQEAVIQIDDDIILYAGAREEAPAFAAERTIAGRGRLAMPGLVNAHTHVAMTLLRGQGTDLPLDRWLNEAIFPVEARMTDEDVYWGTMLGIMEMLRFGTTAFLDMYDHEEQVALAVAKTGMRATLSRGMTGASQQEAHKIKESVELYQNWHGACDGRLRVMMAPHAEYTTSPEFLRMIIAQCEQLGCGVHVHVSETHKEVQGCIERHGVTPVRYFADLGLFDRHTVAAHCVAITQDDADLLAEKGVYIAHNPISNLKLGSGIMPLHKGLIPRTALGTDGMASNNTHNLFEEVRFAALLHKGMLQDPSVMPAVDTLRMATGHGAQALGFEKVGTLSAGMKADLILLKVTGAHATPLSDVAAHVAYAAQGSDVSLTMVDGQVLYEDGQFATFDAQEVLAQGRACAKRLLEG